MTFAATICVYLPGTACEVYQRWLYRRAADATAARGNALPVIIATLAFAAPADALTTPWTCAPGARRRPDAQLLEHGDRSQSLHSVPAADRGACAGRQADRPRRVSRGRPLTACSTTP